MFRLLRYFSFSSLVLISVSALFLALLSQYVSNQTLLEQGQAQNEAVAAALGSQFEQQAREYLDSNNPSQRALFSQWIEQQLSGKKLALSVRRLELFDRQGQGVFHYISSETSPALSAGQLRDLQDGRTFSEQVSIDLADQQGQQVVTLLPLILTGPGADAFIAIATDISAMHQRNQKHLVVLWAVGGLVMLLLYVALLISVRYAARALKQQHGQMQEAISEQKDIKIKLEDRVADRTQVLKNEINERRHIEQSLSEKEAYLQAVMANIFNGIVCIDSRGIILSFNPTAEKMFGYHQDQVEGKNVSLLMPSDHAHQHDGYIKHYLETGEAAIIGSLRELVGLRQDGSEFPIELAITEAQIAGKSIFIGTIRDISDAKVAERALLDARQKYYHQEKMAAIGFLSAGLVHEIGNPVSAISGLLDNLCHPDSDDLNCSKLASSQLRLAQEQVERIIKITRDVSEFATPQTQEPELQDLNNLIGRTCRLMRHDRRFSDVEVRLKLDNQIPAIVAVGDHLVQVLMNLLVNAVDAVAELADERRIIRVQSGSEPERGQVWFDVVDKGCGMSDAVLERASDAFFTTKLVGQGTGLGLSLCESLLAEHGGAMRIESQDGQGTQIRVSLPIEPAVSAPV